MLPAIDVADGQSVRLTQGQASSPSAHGDALDTARSWQAQGAEWIHLVDLDAAFDRGSNAELLAAVVAELDVRVQLSGGIHDIDSLEQALDTGCDRVNIGTAGLHDLAWCEQAIARHGERVAVALDVRVDETPDGSVRHRLAPRGSSREVGDLWDTLGQLDHGGCQRYVVTDVSKDGMLSGPNMELYRTVTGTTSAAVIASGGIATIDDLVTLARAGRRAPNLEGSVVGKALYEGRFTLPEALQEVALATAPEP